MSVTPFYAAILALLFAVLSVRVIRLCRAAKAGLGDGGDRGLLRGLRVHGNFAEYVPLALLLMAFAEMRDAPAWTLHGLGVLLLAGRLAHALGVSREPELPGARVFGMALTFTVLIGGALTILILLA